MMVSTCAAIIIMSTCAARNIDRSGGRQAEARGSALVEALKIGIGIIIWIIIPIISIFIVSIDINLISVEHHQHHDEDEDDHDDHDRHEDEDEEDDLATESTLTGSTAPSSKCRLTISLKIIMVII